MSCSRRWLALLISCCVPARASESPIFQRLGDPGYIPLSVNSDGSVIVGTSNFVFAALWTAPAGWSTLPVNPTPGCGGLPFRSAAATAVTASNGRFVGYDSACAVRWDSSGQYDFLGKPQGEEYATAMAVSGNAETVGIVGGHWTPTGDDTEAYLWNSSAGMQRLYTPCGSPTICRVRSTDSITGLSADGTVAVGRGTYYRGSPTLSTTAYRWTAATGPLALSGFTGSFMWSDATNVSADGRIAVGASYRSDLQRTEAGRWLNDNTFESLGVLPIDGANDTDDSFARSVSADGSVVIGTSNSNASDFYYYTTDPAQGGRAFIWTESDGLQDLRQVLVDRYGLAVGGWRLVHATAISLDGNTIVGMGINPTGLAEGWIARIPEPASATVMAVGLAPVVFRRRPNRSSP